MSKISISLAGKRVVVIGGATGIGFAVSELASELGAEIVVASTNATNVKKAAERLQNGTGLTVDLRDEASIKDFFSKVGAFDHLVITAGDWNASMFASLKDVDLSEVQNLLGVRFWGVLAAVQQAAASISPSGSITLTSGMLAHRPRSGSVMATTLGGAIEHMARGMAMDLAPVRVNAVSPGLILTEHVKQMPEVMIQAMVAPLPVPRAATPAECARAYIYLMTNDYATGQILPVDGGGLLV